MKLDLILHYLKRGQTVPRPFANIFKKGGSKMKKICPLLIVLSVVSS